MRDQIVPWVISNWNPNGASNDPSELQRRCSTLDAEALGRLGVFLGNVPLARLDNRQLAYLASLPLVDARVAPPVGACFDWALPLYSEGAFMSPPVRGYLLGLASGSLAAWVEYVLGVPDA